MFKIIVILSTLLVFSACTKKKEATAPASDVAKVEALLKTSPSFQNYINYGLALAAENRSAEALAAYQKANVINPEAPLGWNNICAELNSQQRYAEAISKCERAIELEPNFELAKNNLKLAQTKLEETRVSLMKQKSQLMSQRDLTSQATIDMGMQFYWVKELKTALEIWSRIKSEDQLYGVAQNNIASAYILMDRYGDAERALKIALSREPNNVLFTNNQKWLNEKRAAKK